MNSTKETASLPIILGVLFYIFCSFYSCHSQIQKVFGETEIKTISALLKKSEDYRFKLNDSAFYFANVALEKARTLKNDSLIQICLHTRGLTHVYSSKTSEALRDFYEALALAEKDKNLIQQARLNSNIALVFYGADQVSDAIAIVQKNQRIFSSLDKATEVEIGNINLGAFYKRLYVFDSARLFLQKAIPYCYSKVPQYLGVIYTHLADIELRTGTQQQAMIYADSALYFCEKFQFTAQLSQAYEVKARLLLSVNELIESRAVARRGLEMAKISKDIDGWLFSLRTLSSIEEKLGERGKSLSYLKSYINLKDSLNQIQTRNAVAAFRSKVEHQRQEALELSLKSEKLLTKGMLIVSAIILLALLVTFYMFKKVRKARLDLRLVNEELRRINEELKNKQDEINVINSSLEQTIRERTHKLETKKQQLEAYAFFNAHKLRAPVSTILGLREVIRLSSDQGELNKLLAHLFESVDKLDDIVRHSQRMLEDDADNKF